MTEYIYKNEIIDKYVFDMGSRIVSETGIPSDRYHLGKLILRNLKDDPDFVMQIDAATGESEINESVLRRSVQCANCMRNMGLKTGDVIILMAPNHLDQAIPFYAALYLGIAVAPIDVNYGIYELKQTFAAEKPNIVFCQSEKVEDVKKALRLLQQDATVISFDKSEYTISFPVMLEKYGDPQIDVQNFKAADFDTEETISFLISTSGTTGHPKAAALTHKSFLVSAPYFRTFGTEFPVPFRISLVVSPLQWLSALLNYVFAPYFMYTRVQSSKPFTVEHACEVIDKYKPDFLIISPTMMTTWLNAIKKEKYNWPSFKVIVLGGSAVPKELIDRLKVTAPNAKTTVAYGMSELGSVVFNSINSPPGSVGIRFSHLQYKLVNIDTGEEITEPHKPGEIWLKAPCMFKGYYNNQDATADALTEDGWFKSGDILYRDETWNYYFVERIKLLLKYKNFQISPVELEDVIREHPGVADVVVAGVPDPECGELPAACVVPQPGASITAQEIKDLIKEKLSDSKQLRGGVYFINEMPVTATTKVHRQKIKEIVLIRYREQYQ